MAKGKGKPSKVFSVPAIVGMKSDKSYAMKVAPSQIDDANDFAQQAKCGRPFGADGKPDWDRNQQKRYLKALNERRADMGLPRVVNFDGGYGDET